MRVSLSKWLGSLNEFGQEKEKDKIIFKKIRECCYTLFKILGIFKVDLCNKFCYEVLNTFNKLFKSAC